MSYQVLARKWRPKSFTEMVGQPHVLKALVNALDDGRLHHAYLFTGTRGVGKTSIARLFAKSLNCLEGVSANPCGVCAACREIAEGRFVDLIEVDAASRTKVEDTRELLENVQYAPTHGRYKVYLIDEVHMLSSHSFNALLKTLEEPPEHVKFLLATTDPQKLPMTILSRCLQFNLKNMVPEAIVAHLSHVLGEESVAFEEAALWLLARAADGSMRDAMSLTDQAIAFGAGAVNEADVRAMLGTIDQRLVYNLLSHLIAGDGKALLAAINELASFSPDYASVLADFLSLMHRVALGQAVPDAIDNSLGDKEQVLAFSQQMRAEDVQLYYQIALMGRKDLAFAPDAREGLEMIMLRMLSFRPANMAPIDSPPQGVTSPSAEPNNGSQSEPPPPPNTGPKSSEPSVGVGPDSAVNTPAKPQAPVSITAETRAPSEPVAQATQSSAPTTPVIAPTPAVAAESVPAAAPVPEQPTPAAAHTDTAAKPQEVSSAEPSLATQKAAAQKEDLPWDDDLTPAGVVKPASEPAAVNSSAANEAPEAAREPAPEAAAQTAPAPKPQMPAQAASPEPEAPAAEQDEGPWGGDYYSDYQDVPPPPMDEADYGSAYAPQNALAQTLVAPDDVAAVTDPSRQALAQLPEGIANMQPTHWAKVHTQLGLRGLVSSIAAQLSLESVEGAQWRFHYGVQQASVLSDVQKDKIIQALSDYFKTPVVVDFVQGENHFETPTQAFKRWQQENEVKAEQLIRETDAFKRLEATFGNDFVFESRLLAVSPNKQD